MTDNDLIQATDRLKKITEYFGKFSHIHISRGLRYHHPRYINLRTQEIFDNLVDLYSYVFITRWERYIRCLELCSPPAGVPLHVYAARCYISMWFIDLYVSNRNVVHKHFYIPFNRHYQGDLVQIGYKYDDYLALLNASIRPTYLKHSLDDALYIPILVDSLNVDDSNPFGIDNFTPKEMCYNFALMMGGRSVGYLSMLSNDAMGRGWWLFDWHSDKHACSWFPPEGNYDLDVCLAYILGTACTANLGQKDVDEWQYFAEGIVPKSADPLKYDRVVERGFYGSHEVRTMEIDADFSLARALSPATCTRAATAEGENGQLGEEAQKDYLLTPRFRLIDWVYHHEVISLMNKQARVRMHTQFFYNLPESCW